MKKMNWTGTAIKHAGGRHDFWLAHMLLHLHGQISLTSIHIIFYFYPVSSIHSPHSYLAQYGMLSCNIHFLQQRSYGDLRASLYNTIEYWYET